MDMKLNTITSRFSICLMLTAPLSLPLAAEEITRPISVTPSQWDLSTDAIVSSEYNEVRSERGIQQPFVFQTVGNPIANLILMNGGRGNLNLESDNRQSGRANFLSRSRGLFAKAGYNIIQPYLPSDRPDGIFTFRTSKEHSQDLAAVVANIKSRNNLPIWIAGTSFSGVSAVNTAARLAPDTFEGIVLAAATIYDEPDETKWKKKLKQRQKKFGKRYNNMKIGLADTNAVSSRVVVLHNEADRCPTSKLKTATDIQTAFPNAQSIDMVSVNGGKHKTLKDWKRTICGSLSEHGFYGIEQEAVEQITQAMKPL